MTITFFNPSRFFRDKQLIVPRDSFMVTCVNDNSTCHDLVVRHGMKNSRLLFNDILRCLKCVQNRPSWLCVEKLVGLSPMSALLLMFQLASRDYPLNGLSKIQVEIAIDFSRFDPYYHTPVLSVCGVHYCYGNEEFPF